MHINSLNMYLRRLLVREIRSCCDLFFQDTHLLAQIPLSDVLNPALNTVSQSLVGAINELNASIVAENLWDRAAATLYPHFPNDKIEIINTLQTGTIFKIQNTSSLASVAKLLRLEALGANFASGARVLEIVSADNDCMPLVINDGANNTVLIYRYGKISIDDNLELIGGGTIESTANGIIRVIPNGVGYSVIGATTTGFGLGNPGDLVVSRYLECRDTVYLNFNTYITSTPSLYGALCTWNFAQTRKSGCLTTGTELNAWFLCENLDRAFNFQIPQFTDPTFVWCSRNQVVGEYVAKQHNADDSKEIIGKGSHVVQHLNPVNLANNASFDLPAASNGFGFFQAGDGEEWGHISWTSAAVVTTINGSANFSNVDTGAGSGDFCIFDNGTTVRVINRMGASKRVIFEYHSYTP